MDECTKIFYQRVNKLNGHLGTSIYEVGKVFGFYDPLVTVTNQLILFLSSAFWGLFIQRRAQRTFEVSTQ